MAHSRNLATDGAVAGGTPEVNDAALLSFQTWATDPLRQDGTLITLTVNPGTYAMNGTAANWTRGIGKLLISAYGATFVNVGSGTAVVHFGGQGVQNNSTGHCKIATVSAGATSATALTPAHTSRFAVGTWAMLSGLDIQSYWLQNYGYPPNWHFFEYVYITAINAGTGEVTFSAPISNTYKATWPSYYFDAQGGAAALWIMPASWNCEHEVLGLTLDQEQASNANGRSLIFRDCTFVVGAVNSSMQRECAFHDCDMLADDRSIEVDKMAWTVTYDGCTLNGLTIQSSSVENLIINDCTMVALAGTAKNTTVTDSFITSTAENTGLRPGAWANGASTGLLTVTNTDVGAFYPNPVGPAPMSVYTMTDGVIACPNGASVLSAASGGTGVTRLTVDSTIGFVSGGTYFYSCVDASDVAAISGNYVTTVIDGTHVDIARTHTVTVTGTISGGAPVWAVDGAFVRWQQTSSPGQMINQGMFQITDITQDAHKVYVHTDQAGTWPTLPASSHGINTACHFAQECHFDGCTGNETVVDLSQAAARNRPIYEYSKRTYTKATARPNPNDPRAPIMWGNLVSIKINVITPYTGATNPFKAQLDWGFRVLGSSTDDRWTRQVNLRAAGERVITPSGVTGTQTGDDDLTIGTNRWFQGGGMQTCAATADVSGGANDFLVSIEYIADQGITAPTEGERTFTCRFV